jgi:hypothetical protein
MPADGLIRSVGFDGDRWNACLAIKHAVLKQEHVRLLGKIGLAHVDFPSAVKEALSGRKHGQTQGRESYREEQLFHGKPPSICTADSKYTRIHDDNWDIFCGYARSVDAYGISTGNRSSESL